MIRLKHCSKSAFGGLNPVVKSIDANRKDILNGSSEILGKPLDASKGKIAPTHTESTTLLDPFLDQAEPIGGGLSFYKNLFGKQEGV